jgi:hypothetical protein
MTAYTARQFVTAASYYGSGQHETDFSRTVSSSNLYANVVKNPVITRHINHYSGSTSLGSASKTYVMRGWYATGSVHEYWTTSSPTLAPPSGHTLTNITILSTY